MASATKIYRAKRAQKHKKMGRERKNRLAKEGSTPSKAEFFGDEPKKSEKAEK